MRRTVVSCAVVALALVALAPPANAETEKVPVAAQLVGAEDITAPVQRETGNELSGTLQFLNGVARHRWEGDPYLDGTAVVGYDLVSAWSCDPALTCKVTGRLWGTITLEPYAYGDGGWEGTFSFKISSLDPYGFSYEGKVQANGYGELEGLRLMLDAVTDGTVPPFGEYTMSGYVLIPPA